MHSLGGLVVDQTLVLSRMSAQRHLREIEQSTIAIAYLGTPHAGSDLATWAAIGANIMKLFKDVNVPIINSCSGTRRFSAIPKMGSDNS